jgi:hypothetical protein
VDLVAWKYLHDDDHLLVEVPVELPAGTEHLKLFIDKANRSMALELWGRSFDAPLQTVDLEFRPLAAAYLSDAAHVVVQFPMVETTSRFPLIAEVTVPPR